MGNCLGNSASSGAIVAGEKHHHEETKNASEPTSLQQALLRDRKMDVYEKYAEIEVLGQGSMGHVARVQAREGTEGGSAFHGKKNHPRAKEELSERRKEKVEYALKSIKLDRVSPIYMTELQNEIDILKGMVSVCSRVREVWVLGSCDERGANSMQLTTRNRRYTCCPLLYIIGPSQYCQGI